MDSKLGYLLSGPVQSALQSPTTNALMVINSSCNAFDLERFWDLESVGVSLTDETVKDNMLKQYLTSCLTRDVDGAYIARFPWKSTHPVLPTNIAVAERRTRHLVKRLAMTPKLLQVYNQILTEQEARGFIERVDVTKDHSGTHYLPHHPVEKDSPTNPIRIVFDCSCRQGSNYPCLNDCLMIGSPCSNDLCTILIRFRLGFLPILRKPSYTFDFILKTKTLPVSSGLQTQKNPPVSFVYTDSRLYPLAQLAHHLC